MGERLTFAGAQWWRRAWLAVAGRTHFPPFFLTLITLVMPPFPIHNLSS